MDMSARTKRCARCLEWLPFAEFNSHPTNRLGLSAHCKGCNTPAKYGMDKHSFRELFDSQGGKCAACGTDKPEGKRPWQIDHDHACCNKKAWSCGKCVRGILCSRCNSALGAAQDDIRRLKSLINYLQEAAL